MFFQCDITQVIGYTQVILKYDLNHESCLHLPLIKMDCNDIMYNSS